MKDYVESLQDLKRIRKADKDKDLSKSKIKEFRKIIGNSVGWPTVPGQTSAILPWL